MLVPKIDKDLDVYFELDPINRDGYRLIIDDRIVKVDIYGLALFKQYMEGKSRWKITFRFPFVYRIPYRKKHIAIPFHRELLGLYGSNVDVVFRNKDRWDYRLGNFASSSPNRMYKEGNDNARIALDLIYAELSRI